MLKCQEIAQELVQAEADAACLAVLRKEFGYALDGSRLRNNSFDWQSQLGRAAFSALPAVFRILERREQEAASYDDGYRDGLEEAAQIVEAHDGLTLAEVIRSRKN